MEIVPAKRGSLLALPDGPPDRAAAEALQVQRDADQYLQHLTLLLLESAEYLTDRGLYSRDACKASVLAWVRAYRRELDKVKERSVKAVSAAATVQLRREISYVYEECVLQHLSEILEALGFASNLPGSSARRSPKAEDFERSLRAELRGLVGRTLTEWSEVQKQCGLPQLLSLRKLVTHPLKGILIACAVYVVVPVLALFLPDVIAGRTMESTLTGGLAQVLLQSIAQNLLLAFTNVAAGESTVYRELKELLSRMRLTAIMDGAERMSHSTLSELSRGRLGHLSKMYPYKGPREVARILRLVSVDTLFRAADFLGRYCVRQINRFIVERSGRSRSRSRSRSRKTGTMLLKMNERVQRRTLTKKVREDLH